MTRPVPEYTEFSDLRAAAIDYAQQASGEIWTDYNLHDPGVTLLEQSCFALSELAYQTAHPDRDLLTDARGHFNFHELAMFTPRKVLNTDPVTPADLEAWLSECPGAARVNLTPANAEHPGLFDLLVVPASEDIPAAQLQADIAAAFDAVRPLCCDRAAIHIAQRRAVRLVGQVEMMPETLPEFVAAALYHAVSIILRGAHPDHVGLGATRRDAYDAPETLLHQRGTSRDRSVNLDDHLGDLRRLPGVRDIGPLRVEATGPAPTGDGPAYLALWIPRRDDEIALQLTLNGAPLSLDVERMRAEYQRIGAERIALLHHHIDAADWQVMRPGRARDFTHRPVDSLLPTIYRAAIDTAAVAPSGLTAYRGAIDGHLASMAADLADLPRLFAAGADLSTHDPRLWRHKLALLDYLIALQGEEMPATRHTGLHHYLGTRARHEFELEWRLRYLYALPRLNAARATAPNARTPGGFLGRLCLLADLTPFDADPAGPDLRAHGIRIGDTTSPTEAGSDLSFHLPAAAVLPDAPMDMLDEQPDADPLPPAALRQHFPWLTRHPLSHDQFLRLADRDSLFLAPFADGWAVLFDDQPGRSSLHLAQYDARLEAARALSQLGATLRGLHQRSDRVALIEDIRLRARGRFDPHSAWLILAGWTARGMRSEFRSYVEQLIAQHAPAHLLIRPIWLTHAESTRFAALHADLAAGTPVACTAMRDFLDPEGPRP